MALDAVLVLRTHLAAEVVDGVVAAEQDAVVPGEPVVVELVGAVGQTLTIRPSDGCQLRGRERLGHQHVVVHRNGHQPVALEERGEDVGAEGDGVRDHTAVRSDQGDRTGPVALDRADDAVLVDLDAEVGGHTCQLDAELGGVHHGAAVAIPVSGEEGVRVHLGLHGFAVEEAGLVAVPVHLMRLDGDRQLPRALELRVHAVSLDRVADPVEVRMTQLLEPVDLLRPSVDAVLMAVGQARLAESAVATGGGPGDARRFEQDDPALGVAFLGAHSGPQSGVSSADDGEVGTDRAVQRRVRRPLDVVEPEHPQGGVPERGVDDAR